MKKDKKQQQQIILLVAVVVVIVGVIGAFYWTRLLPRPVTDGSAPKVSSHRLKIGSGSYTALTERQDFQALQEFGDVPVKVTPSMAGNPRPFVSSAEAEGKTIQ